MLRRKHEYEVLVTYTEVHSVFVEAVDWETAEEIAEEKFHAGEAELRHTAVDVEVNWSDEDEDEDEDEDDEDEDEDEDDEDETVDEEG